MIAAKASPLLLPGPVPQKVHDGREHPLPVVRPPAISRQRWAGLDWPERLEALYTVVGQARLENSIRVFVANDILKPAGVDGRDYLGQMQAIYDWVVANIFYVKEADEFIQDPLDTLLYRIGDCDDVAVLLATCASTIRLESRFTLAGRNKPRWGGAPRAWTSTTGLNLPGEPTHIYVEIGTPQDCKPNAAGVLVCTIDYRKADTTAPWIPFGAVTSKQVTRGAGLAGPTELASYLRVYRRQIAGGFVLAVLAFIVLLAAFSYTRTNRLT